MSSKKNMFQFELNETLYFHPGDEVEELINISLEPDVIIEESEPDTVLRGEIEMHGEFLRAKEQLNDTLDDMSNIQTRRFIDRVMEKDFETGTFTHYFPIEISIPAYRIKDKENLQVKMTSFDYELPANNMLKLAATAEIHGIEADNILSRSENQEAELIEEPEEATYFEFELNNDLEEIVDEKHPDEKRETSEAIIDSENQERISEHMEEIEQIETSFEKAAEEESSHEVRTEIEEREEKSEQEISVAEGVNVKEESVTDTNYLTDMFRDTDEERYTQMRIGIVQENDTIETIADRFQVSTLQLIKNNALDEEYEVFEGQLLFIPRKQKEEK